MATTDCRADYETLIERRRVPPAAGRPPLLHRGGPAGRFGKLVQFHPAPRRRGRV